MSLFKKNAPRVCPKCGEADGWNVLETDMPQLEARPMEPAIVFRDRIGLETRKTSHKKLFYHCEKCGFEKAY